MKKIILLIVFLPVIGFGQDFFTSNCNNGYFNFYCTDYDCDLSFFEPQSFVAQESDSTSLIAWLALTSNDFGDVGTDIWNYNSFNVINNPGNARNKFAGFILSNDDVVIASKNNVNILSPSQNQFNMDLLSSDLSFDLNWENIYDFSSNGCGTGANPNTNFCEGDNGDIYFAYCNYGMTNIIKITNDTIIEIIADSLAGIGIKSLAFHNSTLYVANNDYVYKYNSNILSDLNFQTSASQGSNNFSAIETLELNNDGIPYVVSSDSNYYGVIYKYLNNSWHQIDNNFNFFAGGYSRDFLDFDANNTGYLLTSNSSAAGLSIYKILSDSVDLFYNFDPMFEMYQDYYAMELDNYGNPYVGFIGKNSNSLGLIKYDGLDWLTILNSNTLGPQGGYEYLDMQFNSYNDLYLMYEGSNDYATVVTFCNCDLQPYNSPTNLSNNSSYSKNLIKIINTLGKEVLTDCKNQPLFYIYDDGTVEKKIIIE
jgi:hypothetical protein